MFDLHGQQLLQTNRPACLCPLLNHWHSTFRCQHKNAIPACGICATKNTYWYSVHVFFVCCAANIICVSSKVFRHLCASQLIASIRIVHDSFHILQDKQRTFRRIEAPRRHLHCSSTECEHAIHPFSPATKWFHDSAVRCTRNVAVVCTDDRVCVNVYSFPQLETSLFFFLPSRVCSLADVRAVVESVWFIQSGVRVCRVRSVRCVTRSFSPDFIGMTAPLVRNTNSVIHRPITL